MKRRKPAAFRQPLQRRTVKRRTQRFALTTLSPALHLHADHSSFASPPSALERVSSDVRVLMLQCLDGRHKLTVVCRLSRTFRELPALAFHYDSIAALLQGAAEVHRADTTATGRLSWLSLWVTQAEKPGRSTLFTCPRSLRSLPHLSALETLHITVQLRDIPGATASLGCILRSVLSLQSLTTLAIVAYSAEYQGPLPVSELDWTDDALPSAVSLRHLTLEQLLLPSAFFRRVCCLPLESLEMSDCIVRASDDAAPVIAAQPSVCTLEKFDLNGSLGHEVVRTIASHAQQLRELCFRHCCADLSSSPPWDFSPLMTESGAARLPHLTKLSLPTPWNVRSNWWQPELKQACSTASQQLVAAYCVQLKSLHVPVLSEASVSSWFRLLFGRCDRLDDLYFEGSSSLSWWTDHPMELQLLPAEAGEGLTLSRLRTLTLVDLPLTDSGLLSVLRRCPELEWCTLAGLLHVTPAGKKAALRCCPKLE